MNNKARLSFSNNSGSISITSFGEWTNTKLSNVIKELNSFPLNSGIKSISWDFSNVKELDSSGIMVVIKLIERCFDYDITFTFTGLTSKHQRMLVFYRKHATFDKQPPPKELNFFEKYGKNVVEAYSSMMLFINFIGEATYQFLKSVMEPSLFRYKAILRQIQTSGYKALPIIALTSFLVGLVIAYQSSEQLSKFGANIFIVEMVSISVFRELSPLIAAIVIAGRSASSYTAEIGTMKITEEIDAMKTMGFNPYRFLVLPRVIALVISMPIIVFFADIIGVFGGMIIAKTELGISFSEFILRMHSEVEMKHIIIGLLKAPVFGLIIALIGSFRGFQVSGSTDSIGHYTTVSVVNAIFWVIAMNAIFSVLLTEVGI